MNALEHLGITVVQASKEEVRLEMTVADFHKQPYGFVHGGINGLLIETACSIGGNCYLSESSFAVGTDLQVSHLRSVQEGTLTVQAFPDKIGKHLHVWQATIFCEDKKIAVGRCTLFIQK